MATDRCPKGHALDASNRYEEHTSRGGVVFRCRRCRAEQRRTSRARKTARAIGALDLESLVARQRPTDTDVERATELWANGAAGEACRQAGIGPTELGRLIGCHQQSARTWMGGGTPQVRYRRRAAMVLCAIGTIKPPGPEDPTARVGDSVILIGGSPDREGPWHYSPSHSHPGWRPAINENSLTMPKHMDWWPCAGYVNSLATSHALLASHGYLDDPRTHERATACHGTPGRRHDCPDCTGVQLTTAAWSTHMADLLGGHCCGCDPTCPRCATRWDHHSEEADLVLDGGDNPGTPTTSPHEPTAATT